MILIVKNSKLESVILVVVSSFTFSLSNFWLHKKVILTPYPSPQKQNKTKWNEKWKARMT